MTNDHRHAFEKLYRENYTGIYAFLLKLCGDHYLAEELTQETFYQAILSIHRYRGNCELFTWLASLAKHIYYKYLRRQKKRADDIDIDTLLQYCQEELSESPEEIYIKEVTAEEVRAKLHALPEKYRDVMILRVYAELSFAQIGELFGRTESWARVTYHRAKLKIKERMQ